MAPPIPQDFDAGINRGLGVPAAFYHFALEAGSPAVLAEKRDALRARGVKVTDIVDHGWAQSIYFKDPNGLQLEYSCMTRNLTADAAVMENHRTRPARQPRPRRPAARRHFPGRRSARLMRQPVTPRCSGRTRA